MKGGIETDYIIIDFDNRIAITENFNRLESRKTELLHKTTDSINNIAFMYDADNDLILINESHTHYSIWRKVIETYMTMDSETRQQVAYNMPDVVKRAFDILDRISEIRS